MNNLPLSLMNPVYILYFLKVHFHILRQSAAQTYHFLVENFNRLKPSGYYIYHQV